MCGCSKSKTSSAKTSTTTKSTVVTSKTSDQTKRLITKK